MRNPSFPSTTIDKVPGIAPLSLVAWTVKQITRDQ